MSKELVTKAIQLAHSVGYVFTATSDTEGVPHIAAARELSAGAEGRVVLSEWFCPGTVANLKVNKHITVVVWDAESDVGYQIVGVMEKAQDKSVLNGYSGQDFKEENVPQAAKSLVIKVEKTMDFRYEPHSDTER